jgi:hypothetical protein
MRDATGALVAPAIDKKVVIGAANILQTLLCLTALMGTDAEDSSKVRVYANLADDKLHALCDLMRPMLWNLA